MSSTFLSHRAAHLLPLLAALFVLTACGNGVKQKADFPGTVVRSHAISLTVPHRFRQYNVSGVSCSAGKRQQAADIMVTNYAAKTGGAFCNWYFKAPPARGTALMIRLVDPRSPARQPPPRLHLPLNVNQRWRIQQAKNPAQIGRYRFGAFRTHNQLYQEIGRASCRERV